MAIEGPIEAETPFRRDLEQVLERFIAVKPFVSPITLAVELFGKQIYERENVVAKAFSGK